MNLNMNTSDYNSLGGGFGTVGGNRSAKRQNGRGRQQNNRNRNGSNQSWAKNRNNSSNFDTQTYSTLGMGSSAGSNNSSGDFSRQEAGKSRSDFKKSGKKRGRTSRGSNFRDVYRPESSELSSIEVQNLSDKAPVAQTFPGLDEALAELDSLEETLTPNVESKDSQPRRSSNSKQSHNRSRGNSRDNRGSRGNRDDRDNKNKRGRNDSRSRNNDRRGRTGSSKRVPNAVSSKHDRAENISGSNIKVSAEHKSPRSNHLKVVTLSGTNEVGRNANFIELGDDILIVDCGFSFPGGELLGIDYTIPNLSYLKANKHRIKAILITHGHLDHTGALPYVLPELDFPPIYAGRFANALIKERLKEFDGMDKKVQFNDVERDKNYEFQIGGFKVSFIGVTHSIPNSFSVFVESPKGNVLFSGDYKIDQSPANEPESDYARLEALRGRVDLALMESTNSKASGKAKSESEIASNLEAIIRNAPGRIVVASFASMVSRLFSVIKIAQKTDRKVFVLGRGLKSALMIAREQRYIDIPDNLLVDESKLKDYPDNQVLVICTGSQGERYAALNRISLGEHKYFKIKPGDLILLSSSEIPTNVTVIEKMTDRLIAQGADLLQNDTVDIHESGHALQEDMKIMFDLTRPEVVLPVHGSLTMRYKNKKNYIKWGLTEDKVLLTEDGAVWEFVDGFWRKGKSIDSAPILIDGLGIGDIGDVVLRDREQLSEYGMVVVVLNLHSKTGRMIGNPKFVSRGFVYVKTSKQLFDEMAMLVKDIHMDWNRSRNQDEKELRSEIESALSKYIYRKTEREPIILPVFI